MQSHHYHLGGYYNLTSTDGKHCDQVTEQRVNFILDFNIVLFPCLRIFGGLILDIKRKAPYFWSDFRDAFSLQCLASFLFLYCACMSPVITFGGLLGEATEGRIVCIVFSLNFENGLSLRFTDK